MTENTYRRQHVKRYRLQTRSVSIGIFHKRISICDIFFLIFFFFVFYYYLIIRYLTLYFLDNKYCVYRIIMRYKLKQYFIMLYLYKYYMILCQGLFLFYFFSFFRNVCTERFYYGTTPWLRNAITTIELYFRL